MSLQLTRNLIQLDRGSDELLLSNAFYMRPLYVAYGGRRIVELLSELPKGRTVEQLKSDFAADEKLIQLLRDHRILVDPLVEKEGYDPREIAGTATAPRKIDRMTVFLLLTEACNLGCIYCLNGAETYEKSGRSRMNPDVALRSITACLERLAPGGTLKVAFFGGEPLMNWPLLQEIVRRCESDIKLRYQDRHIAYHLTSNLTMCPPGLTDLLLRHRFTVMCDIDGPPEIHNRCRPYLKGRPSHARTAATIARLVDAGVPVALRATVTSINEDRIFDIAAHHKELGANTSAFVPVSPVNSDRQFLPRGLLPDPDKLAGRLAEVYRSGLWDKRALFPFNEYLLKLRPGAHQITACAAPSGTTPVVRTHGDVYFCIYLVGQEKYRFGSLGAEWDSRSMDAATAALHVDNVEGCRACPWRYACGGGCPVLNQVQFDAAEKNAEALEYGRKLNCDFTKAILTELLWDIADEAKTSTPSDTREGCPSLPEPARVC